MRQHFRSLCVNEDIYHYLRNTNNQAWGGLFKIVGKDTLSRLFIETSVEGVDIVKIPLGYIKIVPQSSEEVYSSSDREIKIPNDIYQALLTVQETFTDFGAQLSISDIIRFAIWLEEPDVVAPGLNLFTHQDSWMPTIVWISDVHSSLSPLIMGYYSESQHNVSLESSYRREITMRMIPGFKVSDFLKVISKNNYNSSISTTFKPLPGYEQFKLSYLHMWKVGGDDKIILNSLSSIIHNIKLN